MLIDSGGRPTSVDSAITCCSSWLWKPGICAACPATKRFLLCHVQRGRRADLDPHLEHLQRLLRVPQVLPGDGQLVRGSERGEVGGGDRGHHGQRHVRLVEPVLNRALACADS